MNSLMYGSSTDGSVRKLTDAHDELEKLMPTENVAHLNTDLIRSLPDNGPVVMVNLVRLREHARNGEGSGWDAYQRYSSAVVKLLKPRGATILWAGDVEGVALGIPDANRWDYAVLVRYPSRAVFLEMLSSSDYAVANFERENALADHVIFAVKETFGKFRE
jgi:uncharacterized protein (DUF1330 family)